VTTARASLLLAAVALATGAPAQALRLVDTVAQPLAYLTLAAAAPSAGTSGLVSAGLGPVRRLLADPALDVVFGGAVADAEASRAAAESAPALALVRGLLARSPGELELVLTSILPSAGQPLLLLRARLSSSEAARLGRLLADGQLATPSRRIADRAVYRLRRADGDTAASAPRPGEQVELALLGDDLLVGNDGSAMAELLALPAQTSASARPGSLAADARFVALRAQSNPQPGGVWLYADWRRLAGRMPAALSGIPGALLGSSGLAAARAMVASIGSTPAGSTASGSTSSGLVAELVVAFDGDGAGSERVLRGPGIDGWLNAVQPVAPKLLAVELPSNGLGGLVVSVDLATVARRCGSGSQLLRDVECAFRRYGLDFQRQLLDRLGSRGIVQLQLGRGGTAAVSSVYSLRAQNRAAATDVLADLRRVCEAEGLGRMVAPEGKDGRAVSALVIRSPRHEAAVAVLALDDQLLLAPSAEALFAFVSEQQKGEQQKGDVVRGNKARIRREQAAAVAAAGNREVAGLFDLDLEPLFEQIAAALGQTAVKVDFSQLPKRHSGFVDLQRGSAGSVVRVSVTAAR
jgi:hypothetical protein